MGRAHLTVFLLFFFNDTAATEIYTLSLHDALPICGDGAGAAGGPRRRPAGAHGQPLLLPHLPGAARGHRGADRKSTRLNSSHANISYAVFCLKTLSTKTKTSDMLSTAEFIVIVNEL